LPRIIFWNTNKKDLTDLVCSITASTNADIVVLIESNGSPKEMLTALQTNVSPDFYYPTVIEPQIRQRFHCFCRTPKLDLSEIHSGVRVSVRKLKIGHDETLLMLVHGIDPRNYDPASRQSNIQLIADEMRHVQSQEKTNKLILLGDFNMNPFDSGMNLPTGLNAMMTKACVKPGRRTYQYNEYEYYYNPMWSLFGDNTDGPAGTIYDTSQQGPYGWNMFEQVIVHHSLIEIFHSVQILTEAGKESLMTSKGRPNKKTASDHFPILANFYMGDE